MYGNFWVLKFVSNYQLTDNYTGSIYMKMYSKINLKPEGP